MSGSIYGIEWAFGVVWRLVLKARKKVWSFASFPVKLSTKKNREEGGLEQVRREGSGSRDASNLRGGREGRGRGYDS